MRLCIAILLAGLAPQDTAAPLVDEDFKDLQDDDALEKPAAEALRGADEAQCYSLLQKKDETIVRANAAVRDQVPAPEYEEIWQTNLYRMLLGKTPLKINPKLCDAAREHSTDM